MTMDDLKSLRIAFDTETGLSPDAKPIQRRLSAMQGMYADRGAFAKMLRGDDPLVYEFYDLGLPEQAGEIAFGTSMVYAGKVGDEYFMTKGHFHSILDTGEVYYTIRGGGCLLMESPEGDWEVRDLAPGCAVYVPPRYAHRTINTSADETLVTFFAFRADAGHDYGTIETRGFRKRVVDRNGQPEIVDNSSVSSSKLLRS